MKFSLNITMDNAAFDGGSLAAGAELGRLLHSLAFDLENDGATRGDLYTMIDANGNRVGEGTIKGRRPGGEV